MEAAAAATAYMQEMSPAASAMQLGDVSHRAVHHVSTAEAPVRTPTLRFAWSDILGLRGGSMRLAVRADQSKPCATKDTTAHIKHISHFDHGMLMPDHTQLYSVTALKLHDILAVPHLQGLGAH
jgi:hypothetical protein